jgi:hypothetical protein
MRFSTTRLLTAAAAALAALVLLAPAALAQTAPWSLVTSPNASPGNNQLNAVTSITAGDVWAVGSAENSLGNDQPLAEHWNGTAWAVVATPAVVTGTFSGVAAISGTDVWAGGGFLLSSRGNTAQFEHWNGRKWSVAKSPAVAGASISGMAAVSSTNVWAVGRSLTSTGVAQTLIEHWNGRNWSVVTSPNASAQNNLLAGVTAISANDVWAVGDFQTTTGAGTVFQTLTEHWNGTAWSIVASPSGVGPGAGLNGVAAVSASDVWAVGDSGSGTLIEQWNGTSWAVVPSPNPSTAVFSTLSGAAVVSASDIWAVGQSRNSSGIPATLIEQWNGTSWTIVTSPAPGSASQLSGASADPASGQAWAVGNSTPAAAGAATQTLTEFNP